MLGIIIKTKISGFFFLISGAFAMNKQTAKLNSIALDIFAISETIERWHQIYNDYINNGPIFQKKTIESLKELKSFIGEGEYVISDLQIQDLQIQLQDKLTQIKKIDEKEVKNLVKLVKLVEQVSSKANQALQELEKLEGLKKEIINKIDEKIENLKKEKGQKGQKETKAEKDRLLVEAAEAAKKKAGAEAQLKSARADLKVAEADLKVAEADLEVAKEYQKLAVYNKIVGSPKTFEALAELNSKITDLENKIQILKNKVNSLPRSIQLLVEQIENPAVISPGNMRYLDPRSLLKPDRSLSNSVLNY